MKIKIFRMKMSTPAEKRMTQGRMKQARIEGHRKTKTLRCARRFFKRQSPKQNPKKRKKKTGK